MGDSDRLTFAGKVVWGLLAPAVIGCLTGACVAGLLASVERFGNAKLEQLPGVVPALFGPVALLLTLLISRFITRVESPSTSELYISIYHSPDPHVPIAQVPGRVLATSATVGLGGSQGFESTSAFIGATWGELLGRVVTPPKWTRRSLLTAGASAGIAAVFSSPGAGTLYGMEVPFKNQIDAPRLVPCAIAAVTSFVTRCWLLGRAHRIVNLEIQSLPEIDVTFLLGCVLVALGCGLGAWLFAAMQELLRRFGKRQTRVTRALLGGAALIGLAIAGHVLCGKWITFGSGYVAADWLFAEPRSFDVIVLAFLIRASGNLVTVYGGGGGGVFTSLACNGALVGEAVARALGCDESHTLALFGAACFLGAGYRLPLACMLFLAEAGAGPALTAIGLATVAVAFFLIGDDSVSDSQLDQLEKDEG